MEVVRFADAPTYTAQGHDQIVPRRLQGGEASAADFVTVGHSSFVSGAVVPMDVSDTGKIYVVAEGSITIEQEDGQLHVLHRWDSIYVPPGEARAVRNESESTASIIVITPPTSS